MHVAGPTRTRDEVSTAVLSAITDVSAMNGHKVQPSEATTPFELPDFESITSVEVFVQICTTLKVKVGNNPFFDVSSGLPASSLKNVVDTIFASLGKAA